MKFLLVTALLMSSAFADHHEEKGKTLEEIKTRISGNIDQRISTLQSHKSCVQGATSKEALQACREANKEAMKKLHVENKSEKNAWKEDRKAKKEAKKAEKKK